MSAINLINLIIIFNLINILPIFSLLVPFHLLYCTFYLLCSLLRSHSPLFIGMSSCFCGHYFELLRSHLCLLPHAFYLVPSVFDHLPSLFRTWCSVFHIMITFLSRVAQEAHCKKHIASSVLALNFTKKSI